MMTGDKVSQSG